MPRRQAVGPHLRAAAAVAALVLTTACLTPLASAQPSQAGGVGGTKSRWLQRQEQKQRRAEWRQQKQEQQKAQQQTEGEVLRWRGASPVGHMPADPTDPEAWYPEFSQCSPTGPKTVLRYPTGPEESAPCQQLPLPPDAARFTNTVADPIRPNVNTTQPAYLFVFGTPYGGTTAFLGLLSSSPHVTVPSRGWAHEMQWNLATAKVPVYPFLRRSRLVYSKANRIHKQLKDDPSFHMEDFDRVVHEYWDPEKSIKVDKSHSFVAAANNIYTHFRAKGSTVKFIILARHPCTYSFGPRVLKTHMQRIRRFRRVMEDHPDDSLLIQYEEFVRDPMGIKEKILRFMPELESLDETKSNLEAKMTTLHSGNGDRGAAIGGEGHQKFVKKYSENRMRGKSMGMFKLSWCEGFPRSRKEILPEEGLDLLRFFGWFGQ